MRAAKKGNEDAFASIWREFHPGLLRYLKVKAAPDAEDLAADIWHRVIRALPAFEGDEDGFRGWLFTSARNRITDWYRRSSLAARIDRICQAHRIAGKQQCGSGGRGELVHRSGNSDDRATSARSGGGSDVADCCGTGRWLSCQDHETFSRVRASAVPSRSPPLGDRIEFSLNPRSRRRGTDRGSLCRRGSIRRVHRHAREPAPWLMMYALGRSNRPGRHRQSGGVAQPCHRTPCRPDRIGGGSGWTARVARGTSCP